MVRLSICVPQYKETDEIIKPLLDSIMIQQNINFDELEVVIVNDGSDVFLSDKLLTSYPYKIRYIKAEHGGVSATRNKAFDYSFGEYVMFCDADDMFCNACGLYILFREMQGEGFDSIVSAFVEETRHPQTKEPLYINHDMDSTFVHGKCHRRKYLLDNNIRWNDNLTIHEDSFFDCLCQKLSKNVKYCPTPFYLWKWRDDSVCRHDPKYILRTYNNMLESNTALVNEFLNRGSKEDAMFYATSMIMDAYFTLNTDAWLKQENQEYRHATELRFKKYWTDFKDLFNAIPIGVKTQIVAGIRQRFYAEGLLMESITFEQFIKTIENL